MTGLGDLKGELLETQGEVDIGDNDAGVQLESSRSEVEDAVDAVFNETIGNLLGRIRWNRDDSKPDTTVFKGRFQFGDGLNRSFVENDPPGTGIRVEDGCDVKVELIEGTVGEQCPADVACSDQCRVPDQITPENSSQVLMQLADVVPDPGMPELTDEGQVLSDLGIRQPQKRTDLLGADHHPIGRKKHDELSQIEAESPGRRSGNVLLAIHADSLSRTTEVQ